MDMQFGMEFTSDWFSHNIPTWEKLWPMMKPTRVLEIGSYEGRSSCWFIDKLAGVPGAELHCIDPWLYEGGHVERRFRANVQAATKAPGAPVVHAYKERSDLRMARMLVEGGRDSFDLVYVDGAHEAHEVLSDVVLAFKLVRVGGFMILDDYWWTPPEKRNVLESPKAALDAFTTIYFDRLRAIDGQPMYQLYLQKVRGLDHQ
jgi:predicted O-methyltransferase YrrM